MSELRSDQAMPELGPILEALIFVSKEPLTPDKMLEALQSADIDVKAKDVKKALEALSLAWADDKRPCGRGLVLRKIAEGYMFATAPEHATAVKKVIQAKPIELSKAQSEVLAIVAYRQPLTRVDIDEIRGVDSSFALKKLMQLKLLKILGKSEGLGRPLLYGTTRDFLEFFALNSLNDLPTLKQYESLGPLEEDPHEQREVTFKDLFNECKDSFIISPDVERQSDEALKNLDEALIQVDRVGRVQENENN